ncbi:hypothetical protein B4125_3479 [Bacillus paralicheniformis]|nr:hypothetical protein SC10_B2orf06536 [Bacillus paralicheniformis]OLG05407.1 hypothetical protein B4125_3479 [Bacillus paralicheniformis]TWJ47551.1 hypothetical protein CHCC5027_3976 [Bacillus paralicheniformis]TWJ53853.1 hypothetical protein CHCC5022_0419 [Bacillus paralicheniformis]TWJ60334.1 hypothetical protein CHCC5021_3523 [Bacillus paralicheniformis]
MVVYSISSCLFFYALDETIWSAEKNTLLKEDMIIYFIILI